MKLFLATVLRTTSKLSLVCLWFGASVVQASPVTPDRIHQAVEQFVAAHDFESPYPVDLTVKRLDNRLRLKPCDSALEVRFRDDQRESGNTHVEVACMSQAPWKIHVAVNVKVWTDAVVASQPIARDSTLSASDVQFLKVDQSTLYHGHFSDLEDVIGLTAATPIRGDQILNARHLRAPYLVNKGQRVTILAISGNFAIRTNGTALANASRGQNVKIKNSDSGRIVDAIAVDRATVEVPL